MKWIKESSSNKVEGIGKRVAKIQADADARITVDFDQRLF